MRAIFGFERLGDVVPLPPLEIDSGELGGVNIIGRAPRALPTVYFGIVTLDVVRVTNGALGKLVLLKIGKSAIWELTFCR